VALIWAAGKTYALSFDAFSPQGNRTIAVAQEQGSGDYHAIGGSATQIVPLTNTPRTFTCQFAGTEPNTGGRLTFNCGNNAFDGAYKRIIECGFASPLLRGLLRRGNDILGKYVDMSDCNGFAWRLLRAVGMLSFCHSRGGGNPHSTSFLIHLI
jgi:hypothetical protein